MINSVISGIWRGGIASLIAPNIFGNSHTRSAESGAYRGAPVELVEAPNGVIANKKLPDGVGDFNFIDPTIENLAEDAAEAARLLNLFDRYSPAEAVVIRPAALEHGL